MDIAVVGQLARDLVLVIPDGLPEPGTSGAVTDRIECLGGKGANQAVALAQLGARPALVAVAGDDDEGERLLAQARADGVDVSAVIRRTGVPTGLIVEVLEPPNRWRYLEHLPLLTEADVTSAAPVLERADAVLVQLQQPSGVALAATRYGGLVVLDGAPADDDRRADLLAAADVIRADDTEAELLTGVPADDVDRLREAAGKLLEQGPSVLALAVPGGNLFVWRDGSLVLPLDDSDVVDTTGGGDSFVAALTVGLLRGDPVPEAARAAVRASGSTVRHAGGRPRLVS